MTRALAATVTCYLARQQRCDLVGYCGVDRKNSLGKQVGNTKTLVAFFTTTWKEGFYQAMAYSTDRGRTYTLYNDGEAIVPNQGVMKGERDPKVFWDEASQKWKMILILGGKERSSDLRIR